MMPLKRAKPDSAEETEKPTAEAAPEATSPAAPTATEIEQVRELLFGAQARQQSDGLHRLEKRLEQASVELRDDVRAEISSLERMVTNKINTVTSRFNTEYKSRVKAMEELEEKLNELGRNLETKLGELEDRLTASQRELRDQVFSQVQLLHTAIQQRHEEAVGLVNRQVGEVKTAATDRSSLASMLVELASKLSDGSIGSRGSASDSSGRASQQDDGGAKPS